jgi:dynein heavy chain, axonemal
MSGLKMDKTKVKTTLAMQSKDGEWVNFPSPCDLNGQVEIWLNRLLDMQCRTVLHWLTSAVLTYEEKSRENWIMEYAAQIALTGSQIWWTTEINATFLKLEEGFENALKDYYKKQVGQLNSLITMLLGDLSKGDRQKIMTICTIDVHARDVVTKMITQKVKKKKAAFFL